ncbi:hypothetical protein NPIL_76791 [Nephila pilipes]|uniref:Uncharacterized protein n=1 Tax=Nephila pilipes TaxID=299642 RepID=A0A8X6JGH7_NEPPI|nr:hypothetical protein NPIL_76791 [Nephila pilipes]
MLHWRKLPSCAGSIGTFSMSRVFVTGMYLSLKAVSRCPCFELRGIAPLNGPANNRIFNMRLVKEDILICIRFHFNTFAAIYENARSWKIGVFLPATR